VTAPSASLTESDCAVRKAVALGFVLMLLVVLTGCGGAPGSSSKTVQPASQAGGGNWVTVATPSGSAAKQGPPFALSGAPAQLTCKVVSSSSVPHLSVYTLPAGKTLSDSQGTDLGKLW
jgi:hypothetical protein